MKETKIKNNGYVRQVNLHIPMYDNTYIQLSLFLYTMRSKIIFLWGGLFARPFVYIQHLKIVELRENVSLNK